MQNLPEVDEVNSRYAQGGWGVLEVGPRQMGCDISIKGLTKVP
jgi:hypothetical protein